MIKQHYQSIIVQTICSLLIPFIQLFALYVIIHGHYGPVAHQKFSPKLALALGAIGMLIFGLSGIVPMIFGGAFLDYENLPLFWVHGAELRALGILIVEIGIGLAVFGTLVLIFDSLVGEKW
ncbi:MAG: hypothetical protein AMJ70_08725 [Dehalococcoidia bacterium SG8_51_3]|nr:MAG: hypothetical protein AMJ70_08725 [Dehalococcoidia bacterium SG8_51_3]